jgi:hypothetical protein
MNTPLLAPAALLALMLAAPWAQADGVADLRAALARPQGTVALRGVFKADTTSRQGDAADAEDDRGQAQVQFEDGPQGLRLLFGRDTLQRIELEERTRQRDPKARTPTLTGLKALEMNELRGMLSPTAALLALLDDATPKAEVPEAWNGQPARRLSFELGLGKMRERDRKYIKKYEGTLDIWIGAEGWPLALRQQTQASGRAFLVVTFEMRMREEQTFLLVDDRLVVARRDSQGSGAGAGEKGESHTLRELQLLP